MFWQIIIGEKMALQIKGKFIAGEAIDGEKLLLSSGQAVRLMSANGEIRLIELDAVSGRVKVNGQSVALTQELSDEITRAMLAEGVLTADLAAEVSARQAADSVLATAFQSVVEAESAARVAGDSATLASAQSYADQKVADLVASAPAVLDTLKELSDALGGDQNFAATIAGQIGDAMDAVSEEESRAMAAEGLLQDAIDAEVSRAQGQEAAIDTRFSNNETAFNNEVSRAQEAEAELQESIEAEQTRAEGVEAGLQDQIDALSGGSGSGSVSLSSLNSRVDVLEGTGAGSVAKAQSDAEDYADAAVLVEKNRAEAEELALSSAISAEETARESADTALSSRLDVIEGVGAGSVAKAEADAKAYADTKIADLVNSAPAVLDTLKELADALDNDANFAATVSGQIGTVSTAVQAEETRALGAEGVLQSAINAEQTRAETAEEELADDIAQEILDRAAAITALATSTQALIQAESDARIADVNAEETRALEAEGLLDGRLDVLEARQDRKMRFELTAQDISNGYIELAHEARPMSIVAAVGRLMIHEGAGEDFEVSVVAGKTRMTFVGNLVHPGQERLDAGDIIFVKYVA